MALQPRSTMPRGVQPRGIQPRGAQPRGDDSDESTDTPTLAAPLDDATVLFRAWTIDPDSYTPGDPWPNEGTAGSDYNALGGTGSNEPPDPGAPELVDDDGLGFAIDPDNNGEDYFYVPNGPGIEAGTGSFTAFARVKWIEETGPFDNLMAKLLGQVGAGGHGWQAASGTAIGGTAMLAANGGSSPGTDPAFVSDSSGTGLALGEHLVVIRLDRAEDEISVFVDGVLGGTGDASGVPTVEVDHQLIFGRSTAQIGRAYGMWLRALTDTEITVDLPAALEV